MTLETPEDSRRVRTSWGQVCTCVRADVLDVVAFAVGEVGTLAAGVQFAGEVVPQVFPPMILADGGVCTECALEHPAGNGYHTGKQKQVITHSSVQFDTVASPVVVTLLAVVFQVSDVVIVAVGVVAAALTPDQPFSIFRCRRLAAALTWLSLSLGCFRLLSLALAPPLHLVDHQHLADTVRAQVIHELLLAQRLEVTRLATERLLPRDAVWGSEGPVFTSGALLGRGVAGGGAGLRGERLAFSRVPFFLISVVSAGDELRRWVGRLWILDAADLLAVLVVVAVPAQTLR